jgi:23S rRNA (cytosine1962-C5)-methyltransferase
VKPVNDSAAPSEPAADGPLDPSISTPGAVETVPAASPLSAAESESAQPAPSTRSGRSPDLDADDDLDDPEDEEDEEDGDEADDEGEDAGDDADGDEPAAWAPGADSRARPFRLDDPWPGRVRGGIPFIAIEELEASGANLVDGEALGLVDAGGVLFGFGLVDLLNGLIRTLPAEPDDEFGPDWFRRRVARALTHRGRLRLTGEHSCYRLVNGEGDGLSGFLIDVYARHVIIHTFTPAFDEWVDWIAEAVALEQRPHSVISKVRPPGETPTGKIPHRLLFGDEPPRSLVVEEDRVKYEVHLTAGLNTGLFVDMRDARRRLRDHVHGQRVLNTFSYTGSFSVVAAMGGAKSVTSVEFATGNLAWERTNFGLNELDADEPKYRFVRSDVFEFLKAARRKGQLFDVVILDPPAATAVPGRRWFMKSDYDRLIAHALGVTTRGGLLMVAASSLQSRPEEVEKQIRKAAQQSDRRLRLLYNVGLPPDFPTQMIHPPSRYLKCYFLIAD